MTTAVAYPKAAYVAAAIALLACLWLGGFGQEVPQQAVRDVLHAAPRLLVQLALQILAPVLLLGFLLRGLAARRR